MKIDFVFSDNPGFNYEAFTKSANIPSISERIKERTGRKPESFFGSVKVDPDVCYLLFAAKEDDNFSEFKSNSSRMILMIGLWAEIEEVEKEFDFLAIVHYPHLMMDKPIFFGRRDIAEKISTFLHPEYFKLDLQVKESKYIFISKKDSESLIDLLIDYLEKIEKLKELE
ncbi:MAG: hypothetical protein DWQ02_21475 [Bacteroidetes bacterium]|nr:MAG: hypothetical protein DWQ02_21475 [Bacteroidota bacterium]